jgi:hypothetical protein
MSSDDKKWRLALDIIAVIGPVVALGAAYIAFRAAENNTDEQYVALAINILRESQSHESDEALRGWAADLLKAYSGKVPPPEDVLKRLRSGTLKLPAIVGYGAAKDSPDISSGQGTVTR